MLVTLDRRFKFRGNGIELYDVGRYVKSKRDSVISRLFFRLRSQVITLIQAGNQSDTDFEGNFNLRSSEN